MRPARKAFSSQPCRAMPASKRWSMWYSCRARLLSAIVPPVSFLSLSFAFAMSVKLWPVAPHSLPVRGLDLDSCNEGAVIQIRRSALVKYSPAQMFDMVNEVEAYPKRFAWCGNAEVIERGDNMLVARLDLKFAGFHHSFTTRNTVD